MFHDVWKQDGAQCNWYQNEPLDERDRHPQTTAILQVICNNGGYELQKQHSSRKSTQEPDVQSVATELSGEFNCRRG